MNKIYTQQIFVLNISILSGIFIHIDEKFCWFLKNNVACHHCDNVFNKKQLQADLNWKCLLYVSCRDKVWEQLFKTFDYEYYIYQYFEYMTVNNYCRCILCCARTYYCKFTKQIPSNSIYHKQSVKYKQLYWFLNDYRLIHEIFIYLNNRSGNF